jgi:outer membrane protein OmpA-like peptidoglycan-associated protein
MNIATLSPMRFSAIIALLAATALSGCALIQPHSSMEGWHFNYNIDWSGKAAARPVQVFSNRTETYFQLKPKAPAPNLFIMHDGGMRPIAPVHQGVYLIAPAVSAHWRLMAPAGHGKVNADSVAFKPAPRTPRPQPRKPALVPAPSAPASVGSAPTQRDVSAIKAKIASVSKTIASIRADLAKRASQPGLSAVEMPATTQTTANIDFYTGSAKLASPERLKLTKLAAAMGSARAISLKGYATPSGAKVTNQRLAKQRAQVVRKVLVKAGFPAKAIHTGSPNLNAVWPHVGLVFHSPNQEAAP